MPGVFVSQCNLDQGSVRVGKMRRYNLYNIFITNLNNERLPALTSRMSSRVRTLPTILWPLEVELQNKFEYFKTGRTLETQSKILVLDLKNT